MDANIRRDGEELSSKVQPNMRFHVRVKTINSAGAMGAHQDETKEEKWGDAFRGRRWVRWVRMIYRYSRITWWFCVFVCFCLSLLSLSLLLLEKLSLRFLAALYWIFISFRWTTFQQEQIPNASRQSYCKQFIRNFPSDCFWFGLILNSFFVRVCLLNSATKRRWFAGN